jgi:hypothetical protein
MSEEEKQEEKPIKYFKKVKEDVLYYLSTKGFYTSEQQNAFFISRARNIHMFNSEFGISEPELKEKTEKLKSQLEKYSSYDIKKKEIGVLYSEVIEKYWNIWMKMLQEESQKETIMKTTYYLDHFTIHWIDQEICRFQNSFRKEVPFEHSLWFYQTTWIEFKVVLKTFPAVAGVDKEYVISEKSFKDPNESAFFNVGRAKIRNKLLYMIESSKLVYVICSVGMYCDNIVVVGDYVKQK